jgi:hypothetical protein
MGHLGQMVRHPRMRMLGLQVRVVAGHRPTKSLPRCCGWWYPVFSAGCSGLPMATWSWTSRSGRFCSPVGSETRHMFGPAEPPCGCAMALIVSSPWQQRGAGLLVPWVLGGLQHLLLRRACL